MLLGFYSIYLAISGYWWKIPVIGQMAEIIPVESLAKVAKENLAGQVNIAKEDYENRRETMGKEKAENKTEAAKPETSLSASSASQPASVSDNTSAPAAPTSPAPSTTAPEPTPKTEDKPESK